MKEPEEGGLRWFKEDSKIPRVSIHDPFSLVPAPMAGLVHQIDFS